MTTYPNTLRKHRGAAGFRQHEVAHALELSSIKPISKWENGQSIPEGHILLKVAILYRVPPEQLFNEIHQSTHLVEKPEGMTVVPSPHEVETAPFWKKGSIQKLTPISSSMDDLAL